jgi:type IV pilus assembly protein PilM
MKNIISNMVKANNIKTKNINFTISSSMIIKREIEIPRVSFDDRSDLIKYEIEQYLPDEVDKYVMQYKVLEDIEVDGELYNRVFVSVIPKIIVDEYYDVFKSMKFNPILFDVHFNSVIKSLNYNYDDFKDKEDESNSVVVVDLGYKSTDVTIISDKEYQFSRTLSMGLYKIEEGVKNNDELDIEEVKNNISEFDIPEIDEIIDQYASEIRKIMDFYISRNEDKKIDGIIIYGGGAEFKYASIYLMKKMNIKVEKFKISDALEITNKDNVEGIGLYINAIGALVFK